MLEHRLSQRLISCKVSVPPLSYNTLEWWKQSRVALTGTHIAKLTGQRQYIPFGAGRFLL